MNESLILYFNLCGAFGKLVGIFCGAMVIAITLTVLVSALVVFMRAFLTEVCK